MDVHAELARLETLSPADLRGRWVAVTGAVLPNVSPSLLRSALAWEIQARAFGGLSRDTIRKLDQLARGLTRTTATQPGMRLVREWQGTAHVVTVDEAGVVRWDGRDYRSLSEVARSITGTRWSGPAFFGLKQKKAAA
jgi:hypothetical protein